jgi:transposase-like protein
MQYSKEEKVKRLEDWKQSGKSAWAFAKENGLNPQTFTRWTKPETGQSLVEVPSKIIQPGQNTKEILIEKREMKIHIPMGMGLSELCSIIGTVGASE